MFGVPLFFYLMKRTTDIILFVIDHFRGSLPQAVAHFGSTSVYILGGSALFILVPAMMLRDVQEWSFTQSLWLMVLSIFTVGTGGQLAQSGELNYLTTLIPTVESCFY